MPRPRLTYANVVSTLCLFLLLGGTAWAATTLPKNSVGGPQLKKGAVTSAKVKDGSLTGADVDAATLGKVPQATSADTATTASHANVADSANSAGTATTAGHVTSADTAAGADEAFALDGHRGLDFLEAGHFIGLSWERDRAPEPAPVEGIISIGPLYLSASCTETAGGDTVFEVVAISATGGTVDYGQQIGEAVKAGVYTLPPGTQTVIERVEATSTETISAFATLVYRDAERTISFPVSMLVPGGGGACRLSGAAVLAR